MRSMVEGARLIRGRAPVAPSTATRSPSPVLRTRED